MQVITLMHVKEFHQNTYCHCVSGDLLYLEPAMYVKSPEHLEFTPCSARLNTKLCARPQQFREQIYMAWQPSVSEAPCLNCPV